MTLTADPHRRRLLGAVLATAAAAGGGPSGAASRRRVPVSFPPLRRIDADVLDIAYVELGPQSERRVGFGAM